MLCELQVEYLWHILLVKDEVMRNWPIPKTVKELKGFIGQTSYHRNFIKGFGIINRPLTELLKKNNFSWNKNL